MLGPRAARDRRRSIKSALPAGAVDRRIRGITRHLHEIQAWVEKPEVRQTLRRELSRYNQALASLQALKQTHVAINSFNERGNEFNEGERFLAIYGMLQALVLQQDAVCHLVEALRTTPVRLNRHRRLDEIRNIRNWSIGHPTKIDRGDVFSHHAIARPKLGRGGFSLHSTFDDGRQQYMYVPLPQLARLQRRVISQVLRNILAEVRAGVPIKNAEKPAIVVKPEYRFSRKNKTRRATADPGTHISARRRLA